MTKLATYLGMKGFRAAILSIAKKVWFVDQTTYVVPELQMNLAAQMAIACHPTFVGRMKNAGQGQRMGLVMATVFANMAKHVFKVFVIRRAETVEHVIWGI
ncbi:MAG: hypothetical protein V1754_06465 [Pseudomonadota bacterium]